MGNRRRVATDRGSLSAPPRALPLRSKPRRADLAQRSSAPPGRPSMMQAKTMFLILGAVAFSTMGQLFLKSGAQHLAALGRLEFLLAAARDVRVLSGLAAWAA